MTTMSMNESADGSIMHCFLQIVLEPGETEADLPAIAQEMIGPLGKASYTIVGTIAGDQWPTVRFEGTRYQLASIRAKWNGKTIGRPRKEDS